MWRGNNIEGESVVERSEGGSGWRRVNLPQTSFRTREGGEEVERGKVMVVS